MWKNIYEKGKRFLYHFTVATIISCSFLGICAMVLGAWNGVGVYFDCRCLLAFLCGGWCMYIVYLSLSPLPKPKDSKVTYTAYASRVHKNGGSIKFISPDTVRVSVRGMIFVKKVNYYRGIPYIDLRKHIE